MSLAALQKRFNDLLKSNSSLYDETSYYYSKYSGDTIDKYQLSRVVCELHALNYKFTPNDFDSFIRLACYKKSKAYITQKAHEAYKYGAAKTTTNNDYRKKCIDIMFTLFKPSKTQLTALLNCYTDYGTNFEWVDTLVKQKFPFNDAQMFKLQKAGYNVNNLLADKQMDIKGFNEFMLNYKDGQIDGHKMVTMIIEKNGIVPNTESIMNLVNSQLRSTDEFNANLKYLVAKGAQLNEECLNAIINKKIFDDNTIDFLVSKGFPPTKSAMLNLVNKGVDYQFKTDRLLHIYETCYKPDVDDLNCVLARFGNGIAAKDITYLKEKLAMYCKKNISTSYKLKFVEYGNDVVVIDSSCYFDLGLYLMAKGVVPNNESLNIVCRDRNMHMFKIMTGKYKLVPNNDTLLACLDNFSIDKEILVEILNYKVIPDDESFKTLMNHHQQDTDTVLEILLNAGLYITYDLLDYALSRRYIIKNLERFGMQYDDKLYWYCYRNNFDCYDFSGIDSRIIKMRKMANTANIDIGTFLQFIVDNDLKLDRYSLEYCLRRNSGFGNELLGHFKCEPTIGSLITQNIMNPSHIDLFKRLLDMHKVDHKYMEQTFDLDIKGYLDSLNDE